MKNLTIRWSESATYEATISVPDDYPETVEGVEAVEGEGEQDWFDKLDAQAPGWVTDNCDEVSGRELLSVNVEDAR